MFPTGSSGFALVLVLPWVAVGAPPKVVQRSVSYDVFATAPDAVAFHNPAMSLAARFDATGLFVTSSHPARSESKDGWRIALIGYGREGAMSGVPGAQPSIHGNRIEIDRGNLIEWYVNDARGIEQGFTLVVAPPFLPSAASLVLECEVGGTLLGSARPDGFEFTSEDGGFVLQYGDLFAIDAAGRELLASMTLEGTRLRLVVDDRDACYPLVIDPLTFNPQWTKNNGGGTDFGSSVASAGDVNGDGLSDVIVGARSFTNGQGWEGAAMVYHGGVGGLSSSPNWSGESDIAFSFYGSEVAGVGDVNADGYDDVAVATRGYLVSSVPHARFYVYLGSASGLSTIPASTVEVPQVSISTYLEIASAGDATQDGFDDVLVGASQGGAHRVYLYRGTASGIEAAPFLTTFPPHANASFGRSLDAAGDVNGDGRLDIVVGAHSYSSGQTNEGAAYTFLGTSGGFAATPVWQAESDVGGSLFGYSVAGAGDFDADGFDDIVVGAPFYGVPWFQEGRVFAYRGSAAGPLATAAWFAHPEWVNAQFGSSVAGPGDVDGDGFDDVLIGGEGSSSGRLFVYLGGATGLEPVASWTSKQAGFLGQSAAGAGDVNGDGYPDVIGGGSNTDSGAEGAQVYHGGPFGSWAPYGVGKKVGSPNLSTDAPPALGQVGVLRCIGGKPFSTPFLFLGTQPVALPFDLTTLYVVPVVTLSFSTLDLNGVGTLPLPIPALPAFAGLDVYFQLGYVDPIAPGPYHTRLSNGVHWWIGS